MDVARRIRRHRLNHRSARTQLPPPPAFPVHPFPHPLFIRPISNLMAARHQLPHMSGPDLERFLTENATELGITPADVCCFRVRRRRRSLEMRATREPLSSDVSTGSRPFRTVKVAVIGDEAAWKTNFIQHYLDQPNPGLSRHVHPSALVENANANGTPGHAASGHRLLEIQSRILYTNGGASTTPPPAADDAAAMMIMSAPQCQVDVWALPSSSMHDSFRRECLYGAHAVVVMFSVRSRSSFEAVRSVWAAEIKAFLESAGATGLALGGDLPIVLVGAEAEARSDSRLAPSAIPLLVPSVEAVQLAQDIGASKYVEIFSDNSHHCHEVFSQACRAALSMRAQAGGGSTAEATLRSHHNLQQQVFEEFLRCTAPKITFDSIARTFAVSKEEADAVYCFTVDGSDPLTSTTAVMAGHGPIALSKPFPRVVKVVARGRCRYPSGVTTVAVPKETPTPSAYFDVFTRTLHASPAVVFDTPGGSGADSSSSHPPSVWQNVAIRYTLDGSEPSAFSPVYTGPLQFDSAGQSHDAVMVMSPARGRARDAGQLAPALPLLPRVVKLVATGEDQFRSRIVIVETPPALDPPRISYNRTDGTLAIDTNGGVPLSAVDIRYTVDGSCPTWQSPKYVRPVMLHREDVKVIRAMAFPRICLPSNEAEYIVPPAAHRFEPPQPPTIGTNRTTMARVQQSHQHRVEVEAAKQPLKVAPGSRAASPVVGSVRRAGSPTKPIVPAPRSTTPTQPRSHAGVGASRQQRPPQRSSVPAAGRSSEPHTAATSGAAPRMAGAPPADVSCVADANTVSFAFDGAPICLSHVTVATPGAGCGPSTYEVFVGHTGQLSGDPPVLVGAGRLDDFHGVQTLHVSSGARMLPVTRVECRFGGGPSDTPTLGSGDATDANPSSEPLYQINDLKIHGKPFHRSSSA